jgi:hypothetical protein
MIGAFAPEGMITMSRWLGTVLFIIGITASTPYARADEILFSNLGPGLAFDSDPFHGYTINGFFDAGTGQQAVAEQFAPSKTAMFTSAQVPLTHFAGPLERQVRSTRAHFLSCTRF